MSAIGRSPKIPLSPSSPPETGLKRRRPSDSDTKRPPTPEYMSVATKSYNVTNHYTSNMDETASRSSPRSPASSGSYNNGSTQRASQPYSTPASSVGIPGLGLTDDADQHRDKRQRREEPLVEKGAEMEVDESILPTNHERSTEMKKEETATPHVTMIEQEQDGSAESLEQLEKDMGQPFLLCRSSKALHMLFHLPTNLPRSAQIIRAQS
jgi:hypothetical protein